MTRFSSPAPTPVTRDLRELLDSEVRRINRPEFIDEDPVQFPHRFDALADIEIAAWLSATIAWGNRKMICRDADRMLVLMDHDPARYVLDEGYEDLPDEMNLHRTFFARHFKYMLRGWRRILLTDGSLDAFAARMQVGKMEAPAWELARHMGAVMRDANNGEPCPQAVPTQLDATALKRINMALRWLVRDDGIVDLGVWRSIRPAQLFIPLDVHVGNSARDLGLITRRANDRRAVEQLTAAMRSLRPDDPAIYDFALFGLGMAARKR